MHIAILVQVGALELCLSQILYRYDALPQTFDVSECPLLFCPSISLVRSVQAERGIRLKLAWIMLLWNLWLVDVDSRAYECILYSLILLRYRLNPFQPARFPLTFTFKREQGETGKNCKQVGVSFLQQNIHPRKGSLLWDVPRAIAAPAEPKTPLFLFQIPLITAHRGSCTTTLLGIFPKTLW